MLLNKDQILKANDLPFREVEVQEWSGSVRIRTMTVKEQEALILSTTRDGEQDMKDFRVKLLSKVLCDEDGERLFTDADIENLGSKSAKVIQRLFKVAQEVNGMAEEVREETEKK